MIFIQWLCNALSWLSSITFAKICCCTCCISSIRHWGRQREGVASDKLTALWLIHSLSWHEDTTNPAPTLLFLDLWCFLTAGRKKSRLPKDTHTIKISNTERVWCLVHSLGIWAHALLFYLPLTSLTSYLFSFSSYMSGQTSSCSIRSKDYSLSRMPKCWYNSVSPFSVMDPFLSPNGSVSLVELIQRVDALLCTSSALLFAQFCR